MNLLWKKNQFVFHTWTLKEAETNARVFTIEHLKFNWCSLFSLPEFTINKIKERCGNHFSAIFVACATCSMYNVVIFNIQIGRISK